MHLYLLEKCLNLVFGTSIKTYNFVNFYKFLSHLGMHHTNSAQMIYAAIDKGLLCIVATLSKFCSMLLCAELHVHKDNKTILSIDDSSQQCLCWVS